MNKYIQFTIMEKCELLPFIEQALNGISRTKAKSILSGGGVMVDKNTVTRYDYPLSPGMVVEISRRKPSGAVSSKYLRIVYEDHDVIVIDKNVGILSAPTTPKSFSVKTILDNHLRRSHQKCTSHVIHRLDRDTSGLMVYGKNRETAELMENEWKNLVTDRRYIALTEGRFERQSGAVESWLKEDRDYVVHSSAENNGGKYALTHFRVRESGERFTLVELKLDTGRKNQIRVHMQDIGHPVVGDRKYGSGEDDCGRLCLHAYMLCFYHPRTHELMKFESEVPQCFITALHSTKTKRAVNKDEQK